MVATNALPLQCTGHSSLIHEHHPDLGDYIYSSSAELWINWRITADGHKFRIAGRSRQPSETQVRQWRSVEDQLHELIAKAIAAFEAPRATPLKDRFSREDLSLREVRMESDGAVEFFFDSPLCDELYMWPMATFEGVELKGWRWVV